MEEQTNSNKKVVWTIVIGIVLLAVVLLLIFYPFKKTEEFNPSFIYFDNYASMYNGEIREGGAVLNNAGYVTMDLVKGDYTLYYKINECPNPSASFQYSYPDASGNEVFYDPFKEKVITNAQGILQKVSLTEDEKIQAVLNEKLYVIKTENTEPVHDSPIVLDSVVNFKADGETKFSYNAKCDGSYLTLNLYRMA